MQDLEEITYLVSYFVENEDNITYQIDFFFYVDEQNDSKKVERLFFQLVNNLSLN
jgi:hypothetical protein